MSDWKTLAAAALTGKVVGEAVASVGKTQGEELLAAAVEQGVETFKLPVVGDGGEAYGTVAMENGPTLVVVADEQELLAWVAEHHPTEVVTVRAVRPSFVEKLRTLAKAGTPVPGIEVRPGDPKLVVRPTPAAREQARRLMAGQRAALPGLEVPHADTEETRSDSAQNGRGEP